MIPIDTTMLPLLKYYFSNIIIIIIIIIHLSIN